MIHSIRIGREEFNSRSQALLHYIKSNDLSGVVLFDNVNILYFSGFAFIPTERPIAFALSADGERAMIVPRLELEHAKAEADPDLLMRAIGNILKNAVEANEHQGLIVVQVTQGEAHWAIEIEDQGPGIAPESLEVIFEPFFTTRSKGTGLGLAFAAQVVFAHGGRIKGENRPNNSGARFIMDLPLGKETD